MSVKLMEDFSNKGNSSNTMSGTSQTKTVSDICKSSGFQLDEGSTDEKGLAIASNGMAAVQYNMSNKSISVRPDNNLSLGSQDLAKFEKDIQDCKQLALQINKL